MLRPYCVGLTGGIGSGKSVVAELFAGHGIAIVDTDLISRTLTQPGGSALGSIVDAFGPEFLVSDGSLDRPMMRRRIFADTSARTCLERILHPLILQEASSQIARAHTPYVLLVVPLLVETGAYGDLVDRILVVDCAESTQMQRVMQRDHLDVSQAKTILAAQISRTERLRAAHDVIHNDTELSSLAAQVLSLHQQYLKLAAK